MSTEDIKYSYLIHISKKKNPDLINHLEGKGKNIIYYGRSTQYRVGLINGQTVNVFIQNRDHLPKENIEEDEKVFLSFEDKNVVLIEH